jgi:putative transposase
MRPKREHATANGQTYMVTFETWQRRALFRNASWANLYIDVLYHYRATAYLLHEFVVMPDHVHVLITPHVSLEKAVQYIKGGFSFRAKKELGSNLEISQKGFSDRRIRDTGDYDEHVLYIRQNPLKKLLCERVEDYLYSSAHTRLNLDPPPSGLPKIIAA